MTEQAISAVEHAGFAVREAAETLDIATINKMWSRHGKILSENYLAAEPTKLTRYVLNREVISELDLPDGIRDQFVGELVQWSLTAGDLKDRIAAALMGLPLQDIGWQAFWDDRNHFQEKPPYMWNKYKQLFKKPFGLALGDESIAGLSNDARTVLGLTVLVRRELTAETLEFQKRPALEPAARLAPALHELMKSGFARHSTLKDFLTIMTVEELQNNFVFDAPPKGTKAILIDNVAARTDAAQIKMTVEQVTGKSFENSLTVGLNLKKEADWFLGYCALLAHSLICKTSPQTKASQKMIEQPKKWSVSSEKDCARCETSILKARKGELNALPPYHVGCRCSASPGGGSNDVIPSDISSMTERELDIEINKFLEQ